MGIKAHYLLNKAKEKFYPYAHADATFDRNGKKVGVRLDEIDTKIEENSQRTTIIGQASGEAIHITDASDNLAPEFALLGKATQNGTPTPSAPIDITVSGASGSVEVKSLGKNFIPYPYYETNHTDNGVTWTNNGDGRLTANGTATGNSDYFMVSYNAMITLKAGTYIVNGCPNGGGESTHSIIVGKKVNGTLTRIALANESGATFTLTEDTDIYVACRVSTGQTVSNLIFEPMISLEGGEYEPYKESTTTITTEGGLAGIKVESGGNYTDESGQQWITDEIVKYSDGSGKRIQRIGTKIYDGITNKATYYGRHTGASGETLVRFNLASDGIRYFDGYVPYVISDKLQAVSIQRENVIFLYPSSSKISIPVVMLSDITEITDLNTANTWLATNPITVYYPLAEPIITDLSAEEIAKLEVKTFYPTTNILNDAGCGMEVEYIKNTSDGDFVSNMYENNHTHSNKSVLDGVTSALVTNWNAAKTHADSAHAPSNAEKNQNAFSNVMIGSTIIGADSTVDTLHLAGSNVTLTPEVDNDRVTIGITKENVTTALGYTPPTTDTKATQTDTTTDADYRVVLSANANDTTETNTLRKSTNFKANPSTGAFYAKGYDRIDITGQTLDINTLNLSTGSPEIMRYIEKTSTGASNITNIPVASQPFILDVELIRWASTSDYVTKQTFVSVGHKAYEYVRYCSSGTWDTSWTKRIFSDTTYNTATTSANGLMASTDKAKLDATNVAYGTCSTAAGTAAKVVTISGNTNWKLAIGSVIVVKFSASNTASSPTLNVNNTGAKSIWYNTGVYTGTSTMIAGYANRTTTYMYDGTYWVWIGYGTDSNTTYSTGTTSTSGLTKLYTGTGTATDGTMTQKAITDLVGDIGSVLDAINRTEV